jgi:WSC domain
LALTYYRNQTILKAAIAQCNSSFGSGTIDSCPPLLAVDAQDGLYNCPQRQSQVNETVTGLLPKLPGCITITEGPGDAPDPSMECAADVTRPYITPTIDSTPIPRVLAVTGQPLGIKGFDYMGCANDSASARVLQGPSTTNATGMTIEMCQAFCSSNKQKYAGLEFGSE